MLCFFVCQMPLIPIAFRQNMLNCFVFFRVLFENLALQLLFCVGIISVLGLVVWHLNKTLFKILGYKRGRTLFMSTGWVGVPLHEFGHAFFCVLFFHKIKAVKWFQPNSADGTLGYVQHAYNKRNFFQQIGNFFIAIGPLLFGSLAILLLMFIFVPNSGMVAAASKVHLSGDPGFWSVMIDYLSILGKVFVAIFDFSNLGRVAWWLFFALACSIAMHMDLSWPDIKGMAKGLIYITIVMIVLDFILCIIKFSWTRAVTRGCLWLSVSVVSFMALAVLLLVMLVLACLIVRYIRRRIRKEIAKRKPVATPLKIQTPMTSADSARKR